jgi:hypothetical protein
MAGSRRVEFQNDLTAEQYAALMNDNVKDLTELRLWSLKKIRENKAKVARAYNKKVKLKEFQVKDLVWEVVLPSVSSGMGLIELTKSCPKMHICLRS